MSETTTIPGINGNAIVVTPHYLKAGEYGPAGTFYEGDADLIADYLANPVGELGIDGIIHHIHMTFEDGVFTLSITFATDHGVVEFTHTEARAIVFALAGVRPSYPNPNR